MTRPDPSQSRDAPLPELGKDIREARRADGNSSRNGQPRRALMAGQPINLRNKLDSAFMIWRVHRCGNFSDVAGDIAHHHELIRIFARYVRAALRGARLLDLGCGQRATQVALFRADGAQVTGIDVEVPTFHISPATLWRVVRQNGMERMLKSLARHLLFDRRFMADLAREYQTPVSFQDLDTRVMDAEKMTFADATFDFVYSTWVLEHADNPEAVLREVNRVLRPGGIAAIRLHLFPSLSGGHRLEWREPDAAPPRRVPPWDHLRNNTYPANVFLNGLRLEEYRRLMSASLAVLEEVLAPEEGAHVLTADLQSELLAKGFTRTDLLTPHVLFICRRR